MKVNFWLKDVAGGQIKVNFTRARWDRLNRWVKLTGIVYQEGFGRYEYTHTYYIPLQIRLQTKDREEILKLKFGIEKVK